MSIKAAVEESLSSLPGAVRDSWKARTALSLADSLDGQANASMARELRAVMTELEAGAVVEEGDEVDDLLARREARRSGASA